MSENKEPQSFRSFIDSALKSLRETMANNRAKATAWEDNKIKELQDSAAMGYRARQFVESEFWKNDLLPYLKREASGISPWNPNSNRPFNPMEVEANFYYHSGKSMLLEAVINQLKQWSEAGVDAEKEMDSIRKRQEIVKREIGQVGRSL